MRRNIFLFIRVVSFVIAAFLSGISSAYAEEVVLAKKTLQRWPDPVVMDGDLPKAIAGKPISNVRMYAYRDGVFEPIRFQIDEMTKDGDWVFPEGPKPNGELGNGTLDSWDKILFMINDTGDRVSTRAWVDGYTSGEEIEVIDPLTGEKGWCYLLYFASSPPSKSSLPDYLRFNYENNEDISDYRHTEYLKTKDGKRGIWMKSMSVPVGAGGSGRNVLDRMKSHTTVKMLFGLVKVRVTEEMMVSNILAYKSGPVRVLRRIDQHAKVAKVKFLRAVADAAQYRNMMIIPTTYQIPFRMDRIVTKLVVHAGFDYNEEVLGSMIYNSNNPEGFLVNGKMDDNKRNMNTEPDTWRLLTGPSGTYMSRLIQESNFFKYAPATTQLTDDVTFLDPPESVPGCIGYVQWVFDGSKVPRGVYTQDINMYWLPNYKPGDEKKYLTFVDNPVRVRAGGDERANIVLIKANMGDVYKGGWMK